MNGIVHPRGGQKRNGRAMVILVLALSLMGLARQAALPVAGAAEAEGHWTVLRVYDGDTVLLARAEERRLVRLLGIDAPETAKGRGKPGQPYSRKAKQYLSALVLNRSVSLVIFGQDRYRRHLGVLYCDGQDINHALIRAGLAEVYRGRTPEGFDKRPYLATEAQARGERRGMWHQGEAYVSPLRWKHPP